MATQTNHYGLTKPDVTDHIDIQVLNDNFDKIDDELKKRPLTINSVAPDENGNINAVGGTGNVKTVNGISPDVNGNVQIDVGSEIELSNPISVRVARNGQTVTVSTTMDDGSNSTSVIILDENDYPTNVNTDGVDCAVTWEGFENG